MHPPPPYQLRFQAVQRYNALLTSFRREVVAQPFQLGSAVRQLQHLHFPETLAPLLSAAIRTTEDCTIPTSPSISLNNVLYVLCCESLANHPQSSSTLTFFMPYAHTQCCWLHPTRSCHSRHVKLHLCSSTVEHTLSPLPPLLTCGPRPAATSIDRRTASSSAAIQPCFDGVMAMA